MATSDKEINRQTEIIYKEVKLNPKLEESIGYVGRAIAKFNDRISQGPRPFKLIVFGLVQAVLLIVTLFIIIPACSGLLKQSATEWMNLITGSGVLMGIHFIKKAVGLGMYEPDTCSAAACDSFSAKKLAPPIDPSAKFYDGDLKLYMQPVVREEED